MTSPQEAGRLVGHPDIVLEARGHLSLWGDSMPGNDIGVMRSLIAEVERCRTALRAVRASSDPRWQAQIISDALRETP